MSDFRIEKDSMGEMQVPADALWGASTQRAVENFPIARRPLPPEVIHAFGHLKAACAQANMDLGKLDQKLGEAIIAAADEVAEGKHDSHFPVDVYQTGSGTSTNMNANEVIATLANDKLGLGRHVKAEGGVHPNDHVNMGQSSNDTFPTAMHIAGTIALARSLRPALEKLDAALSKKVEQWDQIVKIGRTHLMDATPIRMGQVFEGYANQIAEAAIYCSWAIEELLHRLAIGGTAVGTGINTHPEFANRVADAITAQVSISVYGEEPDDDMSGFIAQPGAKSNATKDNLVQAHAYLKTIAVSLSKIANDIRHLGSGPRCGINELILPAIQPGSSIMPGKVNPVICESVMQVCCRVIGNDAAVTTAGLGGVGSIFELNVAMPVMIDAFLESVKLLANVTNVFVDKLLVDLEVNEKRCRELIEQSLMMVTSLAPEIGYDNAAKVAKQAFEQGKTIRELVRAEGLVEDARLDELLDPDKMTRPG